MIAANIRPAVHRVKPWERNMQPNQAEEITGLLLAWRAGDKDALSEMMPLVYRRLKEISGHLLRGEWGEPHLETTALVHETYFRLIALERIDWKDRSHFFAMCARMMRRVLVDHARSRLRSKRGGQARRVETAELRNIGTERSPDLVELDRALASLAEHDKERAQIVELRFFGGLDREEIAQVMGISSATVTRRWRSARAWLINYLGRA